MWQRIHYRCRSWLRIVPCVAVRMHAPLRVARNWDMLCYLFSTGGVLVGSPEYFHHNTDSTDRGCTAPLQNVRGGLECWGHIGSGPRTRQCLMSVRLHCPGRKAGWNIAKEEVPQMFSAPHPAWKDIMAARKDCIADKERDAERVYITGLPRSFYITGFPG
jgi:hypothetical protein